jgi:hypothetical protein
MPHSTGILPCPAKITPSITASSQQHNTFSEWPNPPPQYWVIVIFSMLLNPPPHFE